MGLQIALTFDLECCRTTATNEDHPLEDRFIGIILALHYQRVFALVAREGHLMPAENSLLASVQSLVFYIWWFKRWFSEFEPATGTGRAEIASRLSEANSFQEQAG